MSTTLLEHLQTHPEGILPLDAARFVLGLDGPKAVIEKIALKALLALPGAILGPDGRVRMEPGQDSRHPIALTLRSTGPYPPQDFLLEIGVAVIEDGAIGAVRDELVLPDRLLPPDAVQSAGVDPARLAAGRPIEEVLGTIAPLLDLTPILTFSGRVEFDFLRRLLSIHERPECPGEHLALAPSLRRAGAMPPRGNLIQAARTLRVGPPETEKAGDFARATAEVYLAALSRGITFGPPPQRKRFDFGRTRFGPDLLKELPERPGVYRLLDRQGRVLYVGKSKNLRTRVGSYFTHREKRRRNHHELMERVVDLCFDETGSDLAAQLREKELIREHTPPFNVQREIRRRRPHSDNLVIFLPGADEEVIELLFVRDGAPAGRARSDRKARGMREIRRIVARLYFDRDPVTTANEEDAQVLTTWLRARRDTRNYVDLLDVAGKNDVARRIREYLTDPELFRSKFFRK